ncbi:MAG TPA: hypothetical protein VL282_05965 [Tepidisphaeraceae bacterium]|jgi:hypothetical protein|nr:hypothetical protein [Tepidisphaeraceae bacterium]
MTARDSTSQPLDTCPQCGCRDLFIRKNFPQKIGLGIVIVAGAAFLFLAAWRSSFYLGVAILIAATIVDAILYLVVPKITVCYRCRAEFRDVPVNPKHEGFELSIGERYRTR